MISDEEPVCGIRTECGKFGLAYFAMQGVPELQPVLFDDRGRQFYVTHASDPVMYREIPVGSNYMASGTVPFSKLLSIAHAMPEQLAHFIDFIKNQP